MTKRSRWAVCAVFAVAACHARSDTIYFKDGSSLDGKVVREKEAQVVLELPHGHMTFPMRDVDRIEENAKTGMPESSEPPPGAMVDPSVMSKEPLRELNREDRRRLRDMLEDLLATDDAARDAARQRIARFGVSRDLFPFLERALPYMPDRQSVEALQILSDLDTGRAKPILEKTALSYLDKNRAKSLALLGSMYVDGTERDAKVITLLARGVLDDSPQVQLAGIRGLQESNDKRATPVLLHALESPDRRVQAASLKALNTLWADSGVHGDLNSIEQWRGLLALADDEIQTTYDPDVLEPLVKAPTAGDVDYNLAVE